MSLLSFTQSLYLVLTVGLVFGTCQAFGSCRVFPSEYAYHKDSVTRSERASANCRVYPAGLASDQSGMFSENYIHCNGTQLRLSDSELGWQSQYASTYYYEWSAGSVTRQLLFIFPARVNLTTITLHYYGSHSRGLPPLRFYAVPDDFDVWNAPLGNSRSVDVNAVPAGAAPTAGLRNVSIDFNFNTAKILMVKAASSYNFAVSELSFACTEVSTTTESFPQETTPTTQAATPEQTDSEGTTTVKATDLDTETTATAAAIDLDSTAGDSTTSAAAGVYSKVSTVCGALGMAIAVVYMALYNGAY